MIVIRRILACAAILFGLQAGGARADWMNLTGAETAPNIAEITVLDDRVRIALEVYVRNLKAFEALLPDDLLKSGGDGRPPLAERLRQFSDQTLQVVTEDGTKLQANLKLAEPRRRKDRYSPFAGMINPTTRRRVPEAPKDKRVLYAELEYPFEDKPRTLTFIPPKDDRGLATVNMGFIAYHKAVPVIDFRYLSAAAKLTLDWDDPWYSAFDNPNLKRHHKSAMMVFLYVEPRQVRQEALIRVRDLQEWTELGLGESSTITPPQQAEVKQRAQAFFMTRNPLNVDGKRVQPIRARAAFLEISLTGLKVIEAEKSLDLSTALLGLILNYPATHLPTRVSVTWDLFNDRNQRIPATAIDPAGPLLGYVEASDPVLNWENFLLKYQQPKVTPVTLDDGRTVPVPTLSALLLVFALGAGALAVRQAAPTRLVWIGASVVCIVVAAALFRVGVVEVANPLPGAPEEKASAQIVRAVLENVNHAYLERDPVAVRDALTTIVADDALSDVEAELGRALAIKVAGGGIARVKAIEDLTLTETTALNDRRGFRSLAEWTAKASAGHWGHVHRRAIRFRALLELVEDDGAWKIAGITVVDARQQG